MSMIMKPRVKKLLGLVVLLPAVTIYFFAAAALSEVLPANTLMKTVYFVIAGVVWAFPVKYLIFWMNSET